jgi:hypothetical protein
MWRSSLYGNREIPGPASREVLLVRAEKVRSRNR